MSDYADKLRSLTFLGTKTPNKRITDHTDTATVTTTESDERQDVNVRLEETPTWRPPSK